MKEIPTPCRGCAFVDGAAAHREPYNRLRSEVCALSGIPFFCHDGHAWRERELHGPDARATFRRLRPRICGGLVRRIRDLVAVGYFTRERDRKRFAGASALADLETFVTTTDEAEKDAARRRFGVVMHWFTRWLRQQRRRHRAVTSGKSHRRTPMPIQVTCALCNTTATFPSRRVAIDQERWQYLRTKVGEGDPRRVEITDRVEWFCPKESQADVSARVRERITSAQSSGGGSTTEYFSSERDGRIQERS